MGVERGEERKKGKKKKKRERVHYNLGSTGLMG